jgi:beta-xylosidase
VAPPFGVDYFTSSTLGAQYEWNHDPDTTAYSVGDGLVLRTTTPVTNDLFSVRNQLLRRIVGPKSTATIKLLYGNMKDGDRTGLAMFRDTAGWIGILRDNGTYRLGITTGIQLAGDWRTTYSVGTTVASEHVSGGTIWLRAVADAAQNSTQTAVFSYSTDGKSFSDLGSPLAMNASWDYFLGYRFGVFNYGTLSTGGSIKVQEFRLDAGAGIAP